VLGDTKLQKDFRGMLLSPRYTHRMSMHEDKPRDQLFSELERWQHQCAESSEVFLTTALRCRNHDPGNDTVNNLKVATILQEIALQKYQRTVDALSERLKLDRS